MLHIRNGMRLWMRTRRILRWQSVYAPSYLPHINEDIREFTLCLAAGKSTLEYKRIQHNDAFKQKELEAHRNFFDCERVGNLNEQQRKAVVVLEDNSLVVSSAGSGKTKTMAGKLLYLIEQRNIAPEKILLLTFTRAGAKEITERLRIEGLKGRTFHSVAMEVIADVTGTKPSIADDNVFRMVFEEQLKTDVTFVRSMLLYLEDYQSMVKDPDQYLTYADYLRDRKKYGIQALYQNRLGQTVYTKSEEEKKLVHYLAGMGVEFMYEEAYPIPTSSPEHRQYKPDFTIYFKNAQGVFHRIYLEHFAIGTDGNIPQWMGDGKEGGWARANREYKEGIEWKKKLHASNGTTLIYTSSADFKRGNVRELLERKLQKAGVPVRKVDPNELYKRIVQRSRRIEHSTMDMCQSFILLMKANGKNIDDIIKKAGREKSERNVFIIKNIIRPVYEHYAEELKRRNEMDFTDLILKATELCEKGLWNTFDYILVDEFQDIAVDRYKFLQSLMRKQPLTKLFCVGDDWQSIYRFTGSDVNLFTHFSEHFGYTEECTLDTTYRFGNPLIQLSSAFIQKNPEQKRKDVKALTERNAEGKSVELKQTELSRIPYEKGSDIHALLKTFIDKIPADESVYILGRYQYDVKVLGKQHLRYMGDRTSVSVDFEGRKIKFLTVHASKGLEADHVFILNCNNGVLGFPSMISDDPVLDDVLSDVSGFAYAEERRVFYVGITRAKKHTYLLSEKMTPSPFVTELFDMISEIPREERCPVCGQGRKVVWKIGKTKYKKTYVTLGCDNKSAGCPFVKTIFDTEAERYLSARQGAK